MKDEIKEQQEEIKDQIEKLRGYIGCQYRRYLSSARESESETESSTGSTNSSDGFETDSFFEVSKKTVLGEDVFFSFDNETAAESNADQKPNAFEEDHYLNDLIPDLDFLLEEHIKGGSTRKSLARQLAEIRGELDTQKSKDYCLISYLGDLEKSCKSIGFVFSSSPVRPIPSISPTVPKKQLFPEQEHMYTHPLISNSPAKATTPVRSITLGFLPKHTAAKSLPTTTLGSVNKKEDLSDIAFSWEPQ